MYVFNLSTFKFAGASCSVDSSMTALLCALEVAHIDCLQ